jgi:ABC-type bacteriocin/lantibiotic exporter with double-glycine peptidase domain
VATAARSVLLLLGCFAASLLVTLRRSPDRLAPGGCGPRSLYAVARQLGVRRSAEAVSSLFGGASRISHFEEIQRAAERLGLGAEGRQMTVAELRRTLPLGILHVDDNHFVALVGYTANAVQLVDPAYAGEPRRACWLDADLAARWDGRILILRRR